MEKERIQKRLLKTLSIAPALKAIMLSCDPVEIKRKKIRTFLSEIINASFYDNPDVPSLEWVLTRDAIRTLRAILSERSEMLAGHSVLQYMNDLLHNDDNKDIQRPGQGFFAELDHLLKGIMRETGVYSEKIPAFLKYEGVKSAKMRSSDLSSMARTALKFLDRYPCGLEKDARRAGREKGHRGGQGYQHVRQFRAHRSGIGRQRHQHMESAQQAACGYRHHGFGDHAGL